LLTEFCNEDLSAFFFDIRKDCLYCDAATDPKRMAYRTVLDTLFHALVRYAAPVLVFTSEEVWQTRFPDADSVHFSDWPEVPNLLTVQKGEPDNFKMKWDQLREYRTAVNEAIEPYRREKKVGSSLEAEIWLDIDGGMRLFESVDASEIFITAAAKVTENEKESFSLNRKSAAADLKCFVEVVPTTNHKCGRCWRHLPEVVDDGALCGRCADVVGE
jgi:isoleucyl-tRNA synthetase